MLQFRHFVTACKIHVAKMYPNISHDVNVYFCKVLPPRVARDVNASIFTIGINPHRMTEVGSVRVI